MEVIMKYTSFYPMVALSALFMGISSPLAAASEPVFDTDMIKKTVDAVATSDLLKTALLLARQNKLLIGAAAVFGIYSWATKKQSHTVDSGNTAQTIASVLKAAKEAQNNKVDALKSARASLEQLTKQAYFNPWDWAVSTYWLPWQKGPLYESCVQNFLSSRVAIRNAAARLVAAIDDNKNDAVKNEDIELILAHTVQFAL